MTLGGVRPFGQEVAVLTIYRRRCYFQVTHELLSGGFCPAEPPRMTSLHSIRIWRSPNDAPGSQHSEMLRYSDGVPNAR
jgi:hypothetical protein